MGKVFAILTKKDSISSKYRGYELKKIKIVSDQISD
jgi:hypothetical protein